MRVVALVGRSHLRACDPAFQMQMDLSPAEIITAARAIDVAEYGSLKSHFRMPSLLSPEIARRVHEDMDREKAFELSVFRHRLIAAWKADMDRSDPERK